MFVELVYDKRNVEVLPGARNIILNELTKRIHPICARTGPFVRVAVDSGRSIEKKPGKPVRRTQENLLSGYIGRHRVSKAKKRFNPKRLNSLFMSVLLRSSDYCTIPS